MCVCVLAADALCWLQHGDLWSSRADCRGRLTSWSFSTSLCRPQGDNIFTQPHLEGCDGDTVLVFWVYWTQFFFLFSCLWVSARRQLESSHHWQVVKKKRSVQVCKSPRCGWSRFMVLSLEAQKCFFCTHGLWICFPWGRWKYISTRWCDYNYVHSQSSLHQDKQVEHNWFLSLFYLIVSY